MSAAAELGTVDIGGLRIAYRRVGEAPPLVLLHGWPSDGREWRRQLEGISNVLTVVACVALAHNNALRYHAL